MVTAGVLAIIGLMWMACGVAMIAVPSWWVGWTLHVCSQPVSRFLLTQVAILGGLVLILGTSGHQGFWLWVAIGSLAVLKGMLFLGAPRRLYHRLLERWGRVPLWAHRVAGILLVTLATLLTFDTLRSFQG